MLEGGASYRGNESGCCLPGLVVEGAMIVVISRKSILVIFFAKGPMKTGMFSAVRRESERVLGVLGVFRNNFSVCDKGGCSFVAVDHSCFKVGWDLEVVHLHFYTCSLDN